MIYNLFILVCIHIAVISQNVLAAPEANDESDDAKLEEAIMMVELLKSEYVKLLRDNIALRGGIENSSVEVEQSTCAANESSTVEATTASAQIPVQASSKQLDTTLVTITTRQSPNLPPLYGAPGFAPQVGAPGSGALSGAPGSTPQVGAASPVPQYGAPGNYGGPVFIPLGLTPAQPGVRLPQYQEQFRPPRNYFRRRVPDYYYYDMYRRQMYDEAPMVGQWQRRNVMPTRIFKGPNRRRVNDVEENINPQEYSITAVTSAPTTPGSAPRRPMRPTTSAPTKLARTSKTLRTRAQAQRRTLRAHARRTARRDDAGVADGDKNENATIPDNSVSPKTQSDGVKANPTTTGVHGEVVSALMKELGESAARVASAPGPLPWPAFPFKTTLKIFLEKSTRYPIPLPENHAFCFTNPNSMLCKTLIK